MIDRKLECDIKKTKEFIELWDKFHQIFKRTTSENHMSESKEKEILSTKNLVGLRYEDLMDTLGVRPLARFVMSPSVHNILSLEKISIVSDKKLNALDRDWREALSFLKALLERLERKKRRIGNFNRFAFTLKKGVRRKR
ncbi:MAG: hypothetical protein NG740_02975 [Omnitrophica bacterium]|nr:hypothetical protein [Candidatus Omnitrophota bacterium]